MSVDRYGSIYFQSERHHPTFASHSRTLRNLGPTTTIRPCCVACKDCHNDNRLYLALGQRASLVGKILLNMHVKTFGVFILGLALTARAAPLLNKRKPALIDSDIITINHKVPLDAILLIAVTLGVALMCVLLSVWNIRFASGSRTVMQERARARTELRLRGAGRRDLSDRTDRKGRQGISSTHSNGTVDSRSQLISGTMASDALRKPKYVGPKVSSDRPSRASRGYSVYSKYDSPRPGPTHQPSMASILAVPLLPGALNDSGSESSVPTTPFGHQKPMYGRPNVSAGHVPYSYRNSTTVGRGTDLSRNRSLDKQNEYYPGKGRNKAMPPRPVDSHGLGRSSPSKPTTTTIDMPRSRGMYDLQRSITDPIDGAGSNYSTSRSVSPSRFQANAGYFDGSHSGSGSEEGYSTPPIQHPLLPRSPPTAEQRSRPLAFYDTTENEIVSNHTTGLLHSPQTSYGWRT